MRLSRLRLVFLVALYYSWCDIGKLLGKPVRVLKQVKASCVLSYITTLGVTSVTFWGTPCVCLSSLGPLVFSHTTQLLV